ncbi:MAG: hypothetical protein E7Z88_00870 [Cyanobacteria bacterium SIG27]|nr:hypothetical protein [Cyanobacteria bacterium SIG27]
MKLMYLWIQSMVMLMVKASNLAYKMHKSKKSWIKTMVNTISLLQDLLKCLPTLMY